MKKRWKRLLTLALCAGMLGLAAPDTVTIDGVEYAVTSIAKNAFKNNKKLTKVKIGRNVKSIGESAFSGCKKLSKVELDVNLTKIGKNAFRNCKRLKTITIKSTKLNKKNVGKERSKESLQRLCSRCQRASLRHTGSCSGRRDFLRKCGLRSIKIENFDKA